MAQNAVYNDFQDTAHELVEEFGFNVILSRELEYDFNTGTGGGDILQWQGLGILNGSLSSNSVQKASALSGKGIITTDSKELLLVVNGAVDVSDKQYYPMQGDTATFLGETWNVLAVESTEPGGVPIMHSLVLGRAAQ